MKLFQIHICEDEHIDFSGIEPEVVNKLMKFPSHYQQWAVNEIKKGEHDLSVIDALTYYKGKISDNRFIEILRRLTPSPKNILSLSLDDVKSAQAEFDESYGGASKRELKRLRKASYTSTLVDDGRTKIIKVERSDNSDGAAKILSDLARGTKWCVTDVGIADDYLKDGPAFLIFRDVVCWKRILQDWTYGPDDAEWVKTRINKMLCHPGSLQLADPEDNMLRLFVKDASDLARFIPDIMLFLDDQDDDRYVKAAMNHPDAAVSYAQKKGRRVPEGEKAILSKPRAACTYAVEVLRSRWPEAEEIIRSDIEEAVRYHKDLIAPDRWPEAEDVLLNDEIGVEYAINVGIRFPQLERLLNQICLNILGGVNPNNEIKNDVLYSINWCGRYATDVLKDRWPEYEALLLRLSDGIPSVNNKLAMNLATYAHYCIKGRWPQVEAKLFSTDEKAAKNAWSSLYYGRDYYKRCVIDNKCAPRPEK